MADASDTVTPNETMPTPDQNTNQTTSDQSGQVPYRPRSKSKGLDSYVPQNLEAPIQSALDELERVVGNVDEFVADQLNFGSIENLHKALAAEQVDGVALAVRSLQQGKAALIGDDTGLGKGRQMASAIKYALETGNIPIFITKDPGLYADMARDLADIGLDPGQVKPFMTNSSETIPLPDGRTLKTSPQSHQRELNQMTETGELLPQYNMVFSTYSQLQTVKGQHTPRREFLLQVIDNAVLVLDEAHEAGGSANDVNKKVADRATYTRTLVWRAKGVFFASATATKRPDVMDLYAMRMNVADITSVHGLQTTLENGGTPLQQVAAAMMAQDGQYIRRARTYDGVEVGSKVVETAHSDADQLSEIMREILRFDKDKQLAVEVLHKEAKAEAKSFGTDSSTGLSGARSTSFSSIMWNVVDQAALARKADAVADYAISVLEADEKPFIGLSNTMGAFLDQYVKGEEIRSGDPINVSFQDVLARYLERSRDVTIKDYSGRTIDRRPLTEQELGPQALEQYQKAEKLINQANFSQMPVSPIDWIRYRVESAGYKFGELTGRKARLEYDGEGNAFYQARSTAETSKAAKLEIIGGFNNGTIDVGLGNRSASTGYSMHASEKFSDQRRRHFLIAQPERDINVFKQFMGRFHRTGQVNAPKISLIVGNTPDEKRPAAVLAKKLASLNANTTAARQGGIDFKDIPDYLNEVGDQVVSDMMRFDPDLSERLYDPIYVTEDSSKPVEGAVAKVTGCLPILPVIEQEAFYSQLDAEYKATLERYSALGENPLEATNLDLDARTLGDVEIVAQQEQSLSVFAQGIRAEIVDAKVQSKPKPQLEVINDIRKTVGLPIARSIEQHDKAEVVALSTEFVEKLYQQTLSATKHYKQNKRVEYAAGELDPEKQLGKRDKLEIRLTKQLEILNQIRRFRPGRTVRVVANNDRVFYGAVTAVKKRGRPLDELAASAANVNENAAIPSRWEIVIALADAKRQISLPLSKMNTQSGGVGTYTVSIAQFSITDGDIYQMFDERQGGDREVRTVLKGNLLRLAETPYQSQGDLVVATMSNGQPEPVLLMNPGFNLEKEMQTTPVVLPNDVAVRQFMRATTNKGVVKTLDTAITFKVLKTGGFALQTGKPRKDIFLDQGLQDAAASEFVSVGDRMEMQISDGQLVLVMDYLKEERGKSVAAFSDHQTARDLLGIELPEVRLTDTVAEVITREGLAPSVDMGNLEDLRQKIAEAYEAQPATPDIEGPQEATAEADGQKNDQGQAAPKEEVESERPSNVADNQPDSLSNTQPQPAEENTSADDGTVEDNPVPPTESVEPPQKNLSQAELQRSAKHRLLCEKRVVKFLEESGIASHIATSDHFHMKIKNEPYIPLVVEAHEKGNYKLVFLTHYIQENGDTFHDGEMVFKLQKNGYLAFEEVAARGPQGEIRGYDKGFAAIFSQNVLEQGFAIAAKRQLEEASGIEPTPPNSLETQEEQPAPRERVQENPNETHLQNEAEEVNDSDISGLTPEETLLDQAIQDVDGDEEALIAGILDGDIQLPPELSEVDVTDVEAEEVDDDEFPGLTPQEAFLDQIIQDYDGDKDAILDGMFSGEITLPPELSEVDVTEANKTFEPKQVRPDSPSAEKENKSQQAPPSSKEVPPEAPSKAMRERGDVPNQSPLAARQPSLNESPPITTKPYVVVEESPAAPPVTFSSPQAPTPPRAERNASETSDPPESASEGSKKSARNGQRKGAKNTLRHRISKGLTKLIPFYGELSRANTSQKTRGQKTTTPENASPAGATEQNSHATTTRRKKPKSVGARFKHFLRKGFRKLNPFSGRSRRTKTTKEQTPVPTVTLESATQETAVQPISQPQNEHVVAETMAASISPPQQISAGRDDVQRAMRAAQYINQPQLHEALNNLLAEQADGPSVTMEATLHQQAEQARSLAKQKLQNELAGDITPLAHKLIKNAETAGLTAKSEGGATVFKGSQYAVRHQHSQGNEHIEVRCRKGAGKIHAINGKIHTVSGLQMKDRDLFIKFAEKSPAQLKHMVNERKKTLKADISR
ncbi:MAG: strawberry notch C-terminal domain-containing protein [Cyanobacteria bacterium J06555_13]